MNDDIYGLALKAEDNTEAVRYSDMRTEMGIDAPQIDTKALIDREMTILAAKPFASSFKEDDHAYWCIVKPSDSPEKYAVVIGGGACVEFLDAYIRAGVNRPLIVTLRYKEAGRFSGYYHFE